VTTDNAPTPAGPVTASGTFAIGGDLPVTRLGYGSMRLTGPGIWGAPADPESAKAVLRRAVERGVDLIDTADSYGPAVAEDLIREALHPYDGVTIATKGGLVRTGPEEWHPLGRPEYLRQCVEMSLRRLGLERIDLYQLHRIDQTVPLADQLGVLKDMQGEGKIRHIGLSEVTVAQIEQARNLVEVVSVQNRYNLAHRTHDPVVDYCADEKIAFIPWFPLEVGSLAAPDGPLAEVARTYGATPGQLALAWLLARSPSMLPIPGTSSIAHLEENLGAAGIELSTAALATLADL
jgi:aryl-alcohol dehydrogenase-like predicted oxidoreductase